MTHSGSSRQRHDRSAPRRSGPGWPIVALAGALAFVVGGVGYAYWDIQGNIRTIDVSGIVAQGEEAVSAATPSSEPTYSDAAAGKAVNILVMGSDGRDGENADLGGDDDGMRADTSILVHIPSDRSRVEAISIPRDLLVDIPSCPLPDGESTTPRSSKMYNSAFSYGAQLSEPDSDEAIQYAVACAVITTQELTGLHVDEFILVDFVGFRDMVNSLGGIDVCLSEDLWDNYTGLDLTAGPHHLDGTQALQLARARHNIGDGSDIGRIGRQQQLLTVMADQLMQKNLLMNARELYQFAGATTASLTMSPDLSQLTSLVGLALSLDHISLHDIDFTTVPFDYAGNRVKPSSAAPAMWEALANDTPLKTFVPELVAKHANDAPLESATMDGADEEADRPTEGTAAAGESAAPTLPSTTEPAVVTEPGTSTPTPAEPEEIPLIAATCS